jgi:hypothetical protein
MGLTIGSAGISGFNINVGGGTMSRGSYSGSPNTPYINFCQMPGSSTSPGLFMQTGSAVTSSASRGGSYVPFPVSFPSTCVAILISEGGSNGWGSTGACTVYAITSYSASGFYFSGAWISGGSPGTSYYSASIGAYYIAMGY